MEFVLLSVVLDVQLEERGGKSAKENGLQPVKIRGSGNLNRFGEGQSLTN